MLETAGFIRFRRRINELLNNPVWWYANGPEDSIHILESHDKSECGLLHDDPSTREKWLECSYAAIWRAKREGTALITNSPPTQIQLVVPVVCDQVTIGFIGLAHLPSYEQKRIQNMLPLMAEHLNMVVELERSNNDLIGVRRLWEEMLSTLDPEVLEKRVLEELLNVIESHHGVLVMSDREGHLVPHVSMGFSRFDDSFLCFRMAIGPYENKVLGWNKPAQFLSAGDPIRQWFLSLFDFIQTDRGVIAIPLQHAGQLLGIMLAEGQEDTVFCEHLINILETLVLGSSVALFNSREFEMMRHKADALRATHAVYRMIATVQMLGDLISRQDVLTRIAKLIQQVLQVRKCAIMLIDESGRLVPCVKNGLDRGEIGTEILDIGVGIPGVVAEESLSLIVENPLQDSRFKDDPENFYPSRSYLAVPLFGTDLIGVVILSERQGAIPHFNIGDRDVLNTLAEQTVIALMNVESIEKQEHIALKTIETFDNIFETGNPDDEGEASRFAKLVNEFAHYLRIDSQTCQIFQIAAYLHDIARKQSAIQAEIYPEGSQDHTSVSIRMARRLDLPDTVFSILRDHEEHFDGSGGPRGLKGEEIPLGARLLNVVDAYLHLKYPGQISGGVGDDEVMDRLNKISGKLLDPNLIQSLALFLEQPRRLDNPE